MINKKIQGEHVSMDSVYGNKCLLHVTNIALFGIVVILAIVSICIYYLMPVVDVTRLAKKTEVLDVDKNVTVSESDDTEVNTKNVLEDDFYDIVATRNVFSPQRKDWVVRAVIPKASELKKKTIQNKKKAFAGKPKKFVLHGILIAGDMKKALINNPLKGVRKEKTLYVEEGEDLDGYKVTSIEKDRIKLDWNGEEIVVLLYSGAKDNAPLQNQQNGIRKPRKRMKRLKVNKSDISIKKQDEAEKSLLASKVDVRDTKNDGGPNVGNVFSDALFSPVSMAYESLIMATKDDKEMSLLNDKQKIDGISNDIDAANMGNSSNEHELTKVDFSRHLDMGYEEGLNGKMISKRPTIINLHGIFVLNGIRKAMIEIPIKGIEKKQPLYVEEGDELDGCLVASIDKEKIRLDCQGEERVVTLNSATVNYKQEDCVAEGTDKSMEIMEADEERITEKDNIAVDGLLVAALDDEGRVDGKRIINVFDDEPFNPMSMAYESLFMPAMNDVTIPVPDGIQEVVEELPDLETDCIDHSDQEQRVAMVQPTDSIYKVLEEEELKQKSISNVPTQIILKGIVIAGSIRKALVNVPMSKVNADRTIFVEEGDELEEYQVTKIEPVQIRLDWQGEEMIVTFPGLY